MPRWDDAVGGFDNKTHALLLIACQCNGHSNCTAAAPDVCELCETGTTGEKCEECDRLYYGDAKNGKQCSRKYKMLIYSLLFLEAMIFFKLCCWRHCRVGNRNSKLLSHHYVIHKAKVDRFTSLFASAACECNEHAKDCSTEGVCLCDVEGIEGRNCDL